MHTRECEVLVKDIKCNKFTMSWAKCSLSLPRGFGRSECLADEERNLLGSRGAPGMGFWYGASTLKQYFVLPKNGSKHYLK